MGINAYDGGQDRAINSSGAVSLVFSNVVETIKDDPAQLRNAVYEFARMKLQSEAMRTDPPMNILDVRRLMLALEIAIERVETKLSERTKQEKLSDYHGAAQSPHAEWSKSNTFINRRGIVLDDSDFWQDEPRIAAKVLRKRVRPLVAAIILGMSAAAILGFSLLSLRHPGPASNVAAQLPAEQVAADAQVPEMRRLSRATLQSAPFPLPQVYGVYALSDGQLNELHAIPGRVPDQRVFMSAVISRPSQTILPNGQISFIAFRRDIAGSAPERVTVRLIAKILRAMTFDKVAR